MRLDSFTTAYIDCAFWSSTEDNGEPMDARNVEDLTPDALARVVEDCRAFQEAAGERIDGREIEAGHDFWLTRNGHGAGFWDGDWPEDGAELTRLSKTFGEVTLYTEDGGRVGLWVG